MVLFSFIFTIYKQLQYSPFEITSYTLFAFEKIFRKIILIVPQSKLINFKSIKIIKKKPLACD